MNTKTVAQRRETKVTMHNGDVGELSKKDQRRLDKAKSIIESVLKKQGGAIFALGKVLNEAKQDLSHGTFLQWVDENLPFKRRTAQMYMRIFVVLFEYESVLSAFQLNTLTALSANSISAEDRLAIISDIASDTLTTDDSVFERIVVLSPERSVQAAEVKAQRNAAREQLAKLTYDLAGDRLVEFIELLRIAGLADVASRIEELATEPGADFGRGNELFPTEYETGSVPNSMPASGR